MFEIPGKLGRIRHFPSPLHENSKEAVFSKEIKDPKSTWIPNSKQADDKQ
jgi:hypothetical protein